MTTNNMTFEDIKFLISTKTPQEFFGADPEKQRTKFLAICHPDRNPGDKTAEALYKEIGNLWDRLSEPPPTPIVSPKRAYKPIKIIGVGDIADIHKCVGLDEDEKEYALKISRIPGGDTFIKSEATKIAALLKAAGDTKSRHYYPTLVESFQAKDKIQKHINVFVHEDGFYDLEQTHIQHPALDGRHLAWIFKRLLAGIGFAHDNDIIHGAILPPHLRICPGMADQKDSKAHAMTIVGWTHAVNNAEVVATISTKYRQWYAPEILAKKKVSAETDIYMAARCFVYLAGGDPLTNEIPKAVPKPMAQFIKSLLIEGQSMRPGKAFDLLEDFSDVLKKIYGPPKFVELVMN